jgi:hypothetical protein
MPFKMERVTISAPFHNTSDVTYNYNGSPNDNRTTTDNDKTSESYNANKYSNTKNTTDNASTNKVRMIEHRHRPVPEDSL